MFDAANARRLMVEGQIRTADVTDAALLDAICQPQPGDPYWLDPPASPFAAEVGRDPGRFAAANYVTLALDEDAGRAEQRIDAFLETYYGLPAADMRKRQACFGGPPAAAAAWLTGYADAGATDLIVRFSGEHERHLDAVTGLRAQLG